MEVSTGPGHRCVRGNVAFDAYQGFDDAAALDLMVVLPGDPLFGADIGPGHQADQ